MPKTIVSNKLNKAMAGGVKKQISKVKAKHSLNNELKQKVKQERIQRLVLLDERLEYEGNVEELYLYAIVQCDNDEKYAGTELPKVKPQARKDDDDGNGAGGPKDLTKLWKAKQADHT